MNRYSVHRLDILELRARGNKYRRERRQRAKAERLKLECELAQGHHPAVRHARHLATNRRIDLQAAGYIESWANARRKRALNMYTCRGCLAHYHGTHGNVNSIYHHIAKVDATEGWEAHMVLCALIRNG